MKTIAGIFFIGLPGSGKSTLGKILAQQLGCDFCDSDQYIVHNTGVDIATIFDKEGEHGFRLREEKAINELTGRRNIVLATGGGAVLSPQNRSCLRHRGTVFYLNASVELLFERLRFDKNRPLLQVADPLQKLRDLYNVRHMLYQQTAHHQILVDTLSMSGTIDAIREVLDV